MIDITIVESGLSYLDFLLDLDWYTAVVMVDGRDDLVDTSEVLSHTGRSNDSESRVTCKNCDL